MTGRKKRLAIFLCLAMLLSVCTPLVSSAAVVPTVGAAVSANNSVKVVSTQAQLNSALTMSGVKQIVIRTDKAAAFEIPKGNYSAKKLVIRAPKAEIKNAGTFRSVTIYSVSDQAYTENADHNKIRVLASGGKIVVSAGRTVDSLSVVRKNCRVKIVVNGTVQQIDVKKASNLAMEVTGSIKKMNVNATSTITVAGDSKDTTIIVNKAARNSRITVSAPATVKLKAATTVTLKKGAENAKLVIPKSSAKAVSYTLVNETDSTLKLNTSSGTKTLANGKSYDGKESGGSNTVITGGGSGGTSGGSSGGSGGGNGGGTTEPPVIEKKELPVAAEITGVDSFCVYVDAVDDPGVLDVKVTSDGNEIALRASTAAAIEIDQPKVFYAKDGKPEHVYGYCCTFAAIENFKLDREYVVSIADTDACTFKAAELNANTLKESLKFYKDVLREGLRSIRVEKYEASDEEAFAALISQRLKSPGPLRLLGAAVQILEDGNVSIGEVSVKEMSINQDCLVDVQLEKDGIVWTAPCEVLYVEKDTSEGKTLFFKHYIQYTESSDLNESKRLPSNGEPGMPRIERWESGNTKLISISNGYDATVTKPGIGVEKVTLTAYLSQADSEVIEKTVTVDSGKRVADYIVTINDNAAGTLTAVAVKNKTIENGIEGKVTYQWYKMSIGSGAGVEEIQGATNASYSLEQEEAGSYWYICRVINTVYDDVVGEDKTSESYSACFKVTIK